MIRNFTGWVNGAVIGGNGNLAYSSGALKVVGADLMLRGGGAAEYVNVTDLYLEPSRTIFTGKQSSPVTFSTILWRRTS